MKKFILSLSAFILGFLGVIMMFSFGTQVSAIYTRLSLTDTVATYEYAFTQQAKFGVIFFLIIMIVGLIYSIKFSKCHHKTV